MKRMFKRRRPIDSGEHLWLTSLSDLMILLFCTFVVLFSFTYKKLKAQDFQKIVAALANKPPPPNPINEVKQKLSQWVAEQKLLDQIDVVKGEDSVVVEIKDKVFFESGAFALSDEGKKRIRSLAGTLLKLPNQYHIGIEGHTDDIPIHTKEVQDNWELSSKRALSVLYALEFDSKTNTRISVIARGETQPLVPNRDASGTPIPENQSKNRRVTFRIF